MGEPEEPAPEIADHKNLGDDITAKEEPAMPIRFTKPERTELVISMTLAEIFLLILFVIWYGYGMDRGKLDDYALLKAQLTRLQDENERISKELEQTQNEKADLQKRLDLWRKLTSFDNPPSSSEFEEWKKEICRSNPECEKNNNILVQASVVRGQISMKLLVQSPRLSEWFSNKGYPLPRVNANITDLNTIKTFLDRVRAFNSSTNVKGRECRFDYRLTYGSKEDYYDGRELFERYFYPAGLSQAVD